MTTLIVVVSVVLAFTAGRSIRRRPIATEPATLPSVPRPDTAGLTEVLDRLPLGVVIGHPVGAGQYRNAVANRLAGTHAGVLLDEAIERHLEAAAADGSSREVLELYGPPRASFEIVATALGDGRPVAFVDDITQRRQTEQVRSDFVANVSHELKTPIGAMAVLSETLVDEHDLEVVHRIAQRILGESDRAARTIDDLMELSRIESGEPPTPELVGISDVVSGAIDRVRELALSRSITVIALGSVGADGESTGPVVSGDRRQLLSAVGNLLENAVKYSEPGSSVQVRVRRTGTTVEIAVIDHGIGIPQRDLGRVFERFYRVDRARSRTTGGTGLGLSIVRHVATNHDGVVEVTSVEGEGSTFVLRLPTANPDTGIEPGRRAEDIA